MQPKLFKTSIAEYVPAQWSGSNTSGVHPIGDRVLVLPDKSAEMVRGVHIPSEVAGRQTLGAESGVMVAVGNGAFKWNADKATPFEGRVPAPGDRVSIERYSGQLVHGKDGVVYRLMESSCVAAVIETDKETK